MTLTCVGCGVELEDGDKVVRLECNDEHAYHVECLRTMLFDAKSEQSCGACAQTINLDAAYDLDTVAN